MTRSSKFIMGAAGLVCAVGLIGAIVAAISGARHYALHVEPARVRDANALTKLIAPSAEKAAVDRTFFDKLTVDTNTPGKLIVTSPVNQFAGPAYAYDVVRVPNPGLPAPFANATIQVAGFSTAFGTTPDTITNQDYNVKIPLRFFSAASQPLSEAESRTLMKDDWRRIQYWQQVYPALHLYLRVPKELPLTVLNASVLDSVTGASLLYSHGHYKNGDTLDVELHLALWRDTPVTVSLDLAHGTNAPIILNAEIGQTFTHLAGEHRLIGIGVGHHNMSSTMGQNGMAISTFTARGAERFAHILLAGNPVSWPEPFELDVLNASGKPLPGRGSMRTSSLSVIAFEGVPSDIASIRVRPYAAVTRVVFELPGVPGLPPENSNVKDLLDIRVPYARIEGDWQLRDFIQRNTQMNLAGETWGAPNGTFPRAFTNLTVREALELYASWNPSDARIHVDPRSNTIFVQRSTFKRFLNALAERFK